MSTSAESQPRASRRKTSHPFLPNLDPILLDKAALESLTDAQKKELIATKVADVTHFYVGLGALSRTVHVAKHLVPTVRPIPREVRGQLVQPGGEPVERLVVEPTLPGGRTLGKGVVSGADGVFTLPIPAVVDDDARAIREKGVGLRVRGGNGVQDLVVPLPDAGGAALGVLELNDEATPIPRSIIGALADLVDDLALIPGQEVEPTTIPATVTLGDAAAGMVLQEDTAIRRFPFQVLVRLIEPRTTTVNQVAMPPIIDGRRGLTLPIWNPAWLPALQLTQTRFVDRVPVDKPIGVDRFRDGIVGLDGDTITDERTVPVAGTLGLGYVLDLAQVWRYQGLALGNLLYSLPLAPGEQQRIAVAERVSTAAVQDREVLDIAEQQHAAVREDSSAHSVFQSAFEEHVTAHSSYENHARSSSWGIAGGIGGFVGVAFGVGAAGGQGSQNNNGSTESALDGVRTVTNSAAEQLHRSVESEASGRRSAQRASIRLARETDTQTVTTKVITNHNKAHALTVQYWEVLRKFSATTEVEGVQLVCFVPLDIVRFLPAGQTAELGTITAADTRGELLTRYALLHRHADAVQPYLPGRHQEGLRLLEDFVSNPSQDVAVTGPASDTLDVELKGTFLPYETVWVTVVLRGGRRLARVPFNSSLTDIPPEQFGTRDALIAELLRRRNDVNALTTLSVSLSLPETVDRGDVVGFEIQRAFRPLRYQLDPEKFTIPEAFFPQFFRMLTVSLSPAELESLVGGPGIRDFVVKLNGAGDSIAADPIATLSTLLPGPRLVAALEQHTPLRHRDLLKIERALQHVVRNTMTYSKAVWQSLTAEERVVMLEAYTIGLPEEGLADDELDDASQHVPLLNCLANQVLGYYGNCMVMPFSIPATLAAKLAGSSGAGGDEEGGDEALLTTGAVQSALTAFHRKAFSPPVSQFTLPTRGVLGEAVLGNQPSAEKIDLTRFWNWQDSPGDEATAIEGVTLRESTVSQLAAPSTLTGVPSIVTIAPGQGGTLTPGTLAAALAAEASKQGDFSTEFLGHALLQALGTKTIEASESARADALGKATDLAGKAMTAAVDLEKAKLEDAKAKEEKAKADAEKAKKDADAKVDAAVKDLKDNAKSYLAVADGKADADKALEFAKARIKELAGVDTIPPTKAITLFAPYDAKEGGNRTQGSTAWLTALGLL